MTYNTPIITMGIDTHEISPELYALNRRRLVDGLKATKPLGVVLLQGGSEIPINNTDTPYLFRQESYFTWAFGVMVPDCYGAIEVKSGEAHLFVRRLSDDLSVWMGKQASFDDYSKKYGIPHVHSVDDIGDVLKKIVGAKGELLLMSGVNSDSGLTVSEASFPGISKFMIDKTTLYPVITDLRVYKTEYEIEVIKYVVSISSAAHCKVMRYAKPGVFEYQCESEFLNYCYSIGGCRHVSYTCICASGENGSILHYGHAGAPNDWLLSENDLCLFDMGASYFGYSADITCTFPANGKFSDDQRMVYNAVLAANLAIHQAAKPGVSWLDMHVLANKVLLENLNEGGLLKGDVQDMLDAGLAAVFQPHGLGHFLGLDVHDVGGYLTGYPERSTKPGLCNLRTARVLEEGMVLTIEPGCYFIDPLLDSALGNIEQSKFFVEDELKRFRGFGGVRIEDDVLITKGGCVNLTKVPRTVEEIELWMDASLSRTLTSQTNFLPYFLLEPYAK